MVDLTNNELEAIHGGRVTRCFDADTWADSIGKFSDVTVTEGVDLTGEETLTLTDSVTGESKTFSADVSGKICF